MSRSKNKNRSETEFLKGRIRQLEAEVKHLKKQQHLYETVHEEEIEEVQEVNANQCVKCKKGIVIEFGFLHGTLKKCDNCEFKEFKKKK